MLKDYDMSVLYNPGKANVVADAPSRLSRGSVSHVEESNRNIVVDVLFLAHLGVQIESSLNVGMVVHHNSASSLVVKVKSKQHLDPLFMELKELVLGKMNESFSQGGGVLRYQGKLCVPNNDDLRSRIHGEAHGTRYSIHPISTKMCHDVREVF